MTDIADSPTKPKATAGSGTPKGCVRFMWASGVLTILLFLTPAVLVAKYFVVDQGPESQGALTLDLTVPSNAVGLSKSLKTSQLHTITIRNSTLLVEDLQRDPDPVWREQAATSLARVLADRSLNFTHPMECLIAKSALSTAAVSDPSPVVRVAAQNALEGVAKNGAVIVR